MGSAGPKWYLPRGSISNHQPYLFLSPLFFIRTPGGRLPYQGAHTSTLLWVPFLIADLDLVLHTSGMTNHNQYRYMEDLLLLDTCRPTQEELKVPFKASSPLNFLVWARLLENHLDARFTNYILKGIQEGFRIGFDRHNILDSSHGNMPCKVPSLISEYLQREVSLGRMIKLPPNFQPPGIHTSPLGIVPKKNKPGKWRLIMDLSSPEKSGVSDRISQTLSSLSYVSVDQLSALVLQAGRGAFLTKADIKEAYRMLRVHPQDCHLLGIHWER